MKKFFELNVGEEFKLDSSHPYVCVEVDSESHDYWYLVPADNRVRRINPYVPVRTKHIETVTQNVEVWK